MKANEEKTERKKYVVPQMVVREYENHFSLLSGSSCDGDMATCIIDS